MVILVVSKVKAFVVIKAARIERKFQCYECTDKGEYTVNPEIVKILKEDLYMR